jgi:hypothetical protein
MHRSTGMLFFASAVFSGIIGLSSDSAATWRSVDAAACRSLSASGNANFDNNGSLITSANSLSIICPIIDGSDFSKASVTLHVDIDQNNPNFVTGMTACYNSESALGASCTSSTQVNTSGTGLKHLAAATSWASYDYGYVLISLAPSYNSTTSKIKGYYWSNTG